MSLILGIDTGGTYTDSVIWDSDEKLVLKKAKAFTSKDNLSLGISESIKALEVENYNISAVNLSTTLTVNSILEGKIIKIGLIIVGEHLREPTPAFSKYEVMNDVYDIKKGVYKFTPNDFKNICEMFGSEFPIVLIAVFGEKNKQAEKSIALTLETFIDAEILCASDYSEKKGFYTKVLEAITIIGLKKVLINWEKSIHQIMNSYKINAPIKILTGNGQLVTFKEVKKNPLTMILSGPTASYIGSRHLTKKRDYLLADMGGTSLDITKIENGKTRFANKTMDIGGYKYVINMLDLQSFAIGGDSKIRLNQMGDFVLDSEKVTPLCLLENNYPGLVNELEKYKIKKDCNLLTASVVDCFYVEKNNNVDGKQLNEIQHKVVEMLRERPHSLFYIADCLNVEADVLHIDKLVKQGFIACSSLTPTDVLHADDTIDLWNNAISKTAISEFARLKENDFDQVLEEIKDVIVKKIVYSCMQSIAGFEKKEFLLEESETTLFLINRFLEKDNGLISSQFSIRKPIVGVGASAKNWLPMVAEKLGTDLIIPKDGEVASAIGAAIGKEMA